MSFCLHKYTSAKKIVLGTIILALIVGLAYAQEQEAGQPETAAQSGGQQEQSAAQGGGQQQAAAPSGALSLFGPKPNVLAGFGGNLRIDGMILTGIGVRQDASKTMVNPDKSDVMKPVIPDEEWRLGFLNPTWEENRFELDFHFNGGQIPGVKGVNYGWFATLWAQNYGVGNFTWAEFPYGGYKMTAPDWNQPWVELRYAGLWTSFLQDKIKLSMGRLYDEFYYMPGSKVWKTDGFPFRFSDEKTISLRAEFKPIEGLNVGLQWFGLVPFAGDENQQVDVTWPKAEDAIREIGIGIQYQNDLVSAVGGVRFDGAGDAMNKDEAKTYLPAYYGQGETQSGCGNTI